MEVLRRQTATFWVASASVAAMLIGAIGPWMEILGHGRPGTDRSGAWVIAVAAIAALFVWQHTQHGGIDLGVAGMSLGLIGAAICALDLYEILSMPAAELPTVGRRS